MNIGWQEFLSFYTDLNLIRKQYDEKFQEDRGIGEEVEDPTQSESDDEYNQPLNEASLPPKNQARLTTAYQKLQNDDEEKAKLLIGGGNQNVKQGGDKIQIEEEFKEGDNRD